MKYLCKECIDGMDVAALPPAVDRMASSWRWKRFGDVGVGERERSMVVDVQVWKRRRPRGSWSPGQDWAGQDWTGGQGESTWEGVCQFSPLPS